MLAKAPLRGPSTFVQNRPSQPTVVSRRQPSISRQQFYSNMTPAYESKQYVFNELLCTPHTILEYLHQAHAADLL
jgi:hypothetical protein